MTANRILDKRSKAFVTMLIGVMTDTGPVIGSQFGGVYVVAGMTHIQVLHNSTLLLTSYDMCTITLHCGISSVVYSYMPQALHYIGNYWLMSACARVCLVCV